MKREFLTIQEASEGLRTTDVTTIEWARRGKFKILKLGPKTWRIDRVSFESFIKNSVVQKEELVTT